MLGAAAAGSEASDINWIPEKYQVKKDDGSIDLAASSKKLADGHAFYEKKVGAVDLPPKSADEYTITVPDQFKEAFDPSKDPMLAEFRTEAHKQGLSQKQFDFMVGQFFTRVPALGLQQVELQAADCEKDLRKGWKTEDDYRGNIVAAGRALKAFGAGEADAIQAAYGNDPKLIRLLAAIGKEINEDSSAPIGETKAVDFKKRAAELREEIPKLPANDPRRAALQREYDGIYAQLYPKK